jgi:hypothetical protein
MVGADSAMITAVYPHQPTLSVFLARFFPFSPLRRTLVFRQPKQKHHDPLLPLLPQSELCIHTVHSQQNIKLRNRYLSTAYDSPICHNHVSLKITCRQVRRLTKAELVMCSCRRRGSLFGGTDGCSMDGDDHKELVDGWPRITEACCSAPLLPRSWQGTGDRFLLYQRVPPTPSPPLVSPLPVHA